MRIGKVVGIIQARVGSTRLPNKVIRRLGDKTLLDILLGRLLRSESMDQVVVATTTKEGDRAIEGIASNRGFEVFRGSERDVLDRYYNAAKKYEAQIIVRITADNPLTDISLIDSQVRLLIERAYDYVTTKTILGLGSEVFTFDALQKAWESAGYEYQREHVTPYIYENPSQFRIGRFDPPPLLDRDDIRLTVDTAEDFELYQRLQERFGDLSGVEMQEILEFLEDNPDVKSINTMVRQKDYREVEG